MSEVTQGRTEPGSDLDKSHPASPERREQPGEQERPMDEDEALDESLDDTFPASDPAPAKQIDGPNN